MGKARIISNSAEQFSGRVEAGGLLSRELKKYRGKGAVVLGIPRGGVVVAREISRDIEAELDIVLSRKIGSPGNPELAIGAVSEDGKLFLREDMRSPDMENSPYVRQELVAQMAEIARRVEMYRAVRPKVALKGRVVIVTDDGLATGATMRSALWSAAQERPKRLIVAVPVAPVDSLKSIGADADELIVVRVPQFFAAVGQFYRQFDQVSDEEVLAILKEEYAKDGTGPNTRC